MFDSRGGGVLPYMGYIGMCGPKGYGFSAVLVINGVWFLHSSLDMGMFLRSSPFSSLSKRKSTEALHVYVYSLVGTRFLIQGSGHK